MTIKEAQEKVDRWIRTYGVRYFNELTNLAILAEEVGEVAAIMARTFGEQSPKPASGNEKKEKRSGTDPSDPLADELADVLFVLICIANQTGTDLEDAFQKNLSKKTGRDFERHRQNDKLRDPSSPP